MFLKRCSPQKREESPNWGFCSVTWHRHKFYEPPVFLYLLGNQNHENEFLTGSLLETEVEESRRTIVSKLVFYTLTEHLRLDN